MVQNELGWEPSRKAVMPRFYDNEESGCGRSSNKWVCSFTCKCDGDTLPGGEGRCDDDDKDEGDGALIFTATEAASTPDDANGMAADDVDEDIDDGAGPEVTATSVDEEDGMIGGI